MNTQQLKLRSPNGCQIMGIKLTDGSVAPFECSFGRHGGECIFYYKLSCGSLPNLLNADGQRLLIDTRGNEWFSGDVEFASVPPLRNG